MQLLGVSNWAKDFTEWPFLLFSASSYFLTGQLKDFAGWSPLQWIHLWLDSRAWGTVTTCVSGGQLCLGGKLFLGQIFYGVYCRGWLFVKGRICSRMLLTDGLRFGGFCPGAFRRELLTGYRRQVLTSGDQYTPVLYCAVTCCLVVVSGVYAWW